MPAGKRRSIEARQREAAAIELRKAGATYQQIGQRFGISDRMASRIVNRGLNRILREPAAELVRLECARLDQLQMALWPQAMAGKGWAVDRVLAVMERRARLLGLDAPTKMTVITEDAVDAEIRRLLDDMATLDSDRAAALEAELRTPPAG